MNEFGNSVQSDLVHRETTTLGFMFDVSKGMMIKTSVWNVDDSC